MLSHHLTGLGHQQTAEKFLNDQVSMIPVILNTEKMISFKMANRDLAKSHSISSVNIYAMDWRRTRCLLVPT